jgi:FtsP/CotA-like multicopper oxidase with cupredoxin domain
MTDESSANNTVETENVISRRRLLQTGAAVGIAGILPQISNSMAARSAPSSPALDKFVQSLPVPEVRKPDGTKDGAESYRITREEFTQNLHPDLPKTTLWGFDGAYPGPLIEAQRGKPLMVRFDNEGLPTDHLFEIDERIPGTTAENHPVYEKDSPVPDVRTVTHFHGLKVASENDGQSLMWTSPEGVVGPGFANKWQSLPMNQSRTTSTYHDHTLGIVRLNAYAGLLGMYTIRSQAEADLNLPSDEYDIPLLLQDKTFNSDGSLWYPDNFTPMFAGNTAVVNGAVWPYVEVEPRRYRFRLVNGANHRTFSLKLSNESSQGAPTMYQFAPDHGFLESVVPIGPGGDMDSLVIQPFERGEVIVDFSDHAGETFTLTNTAELPYVGENSGSNLREIMQIRVTNPSEPPTDNSADPSNLDLPFTDKFDKDKVSKTREMELNQTYNRDKKLVKYLLNGYGMVEAADDDKKGIVPTQLGATEIWELTNKTAGSHPIHLHLVTFKVIGRGPDGTKPPQPNERGYKDVVRVGPGETVRFLTRFEGYTGEYPWHCHMLEHEDYEMMIKFAVQGDGDGSDGGDGLPAVVGDSPPIDPDDDGLYEDVNGDGKVNYDDVVDLFEHFGDDAVQDNPDAYDFNGNGQLDSDDIVELFHSL